MYCSGDYCIKESKRHLSAGTDACTRHADKLQYYIVKPSINAPHAAHLSRTAKPTPHKSISTIAAGSSR